MDEGQRTFLFLQGPCGRFFWDLAQALQQRGHRIERINLCGGDARDWPGTARNYRGLPSRWTIFVDRFMRDHAVTDLVLYGDCRPLHKAAHQMARMRKVRVHVFEEGYVRPNWMTLERDGVNGHSPFMREPDRLHRLAERLPPLPDLPPIVAAPGFRRRDTVRYYAHLIGGRLTFRFPFYKSHRPLLILHEAAGWIRKYATASQTAQRSRAVLSGLVTGQYFLFPLQLSSDYQIRVHSPFSGMDEALEYVLSSFAAFAPPEAMLVVKEHPLDCNIRSWRRVITRLSRRFGVEGRVRHIAGGDLAELSRNSRGMVVVNSTSATFALSEGVPVIALGSAIYAIDGIVHPGALDGFWSAPQPPDPKVYEGFVRALHEKCLVRGGLASDTALRILVENAVPRLLADDGDASHHTPADAPRA